MEPFLGQIQPFGFNFAPRGWALCDGQLLPISSYSALFSLLGTMYGGDGRTTFGLPELRGRTMVHFGTGPGLPPAQLGAKGGRNTVTLSTGNLPPHRHGIVLASGVGTSAQGAGNFLAGNAVGDTIYGTNGSTNGLAETAVTNSGAGQAFDVRAPYQVVNISIALVGIFPSRS